MSYIVETSATPSRFYELREKAKKAVADVESRSATIKGYAAGTAARLGADGASAVVSLELSKDRAFMDLVGDRNRDIQLAIMYSNMALLYKE